MALGTPVIGTAVNGAGSSFATAYPASVGANDQLAVICVQRPTSIGGGTFTPPAGWTTFLSLIDKGGYGASGGDTGNMNLFIAVQDALASGGETGTVSFTVGGNNSASCAMVRIPTGGGRIAFDVTSGEDTTAGSVSVACASDPGFKAGDLALWAMAIPTDVSTPSQFSAHSITATGATFGSAAELVEFDSTVGNDHGGYAAYAACSAGPSSGVPTIAATAGGTTTNVRGPVGLLVVREAPTGFDRANKNPYILTTAFDLTIYSDLVQVNGQGRIRSTTTKGDNRYTETQISTVNAGDQLIGVCNSSLSMGGYGQYDAAFTGISTNSGAVYVNGSYAGAGPTFGAGDIVSQQIDPANGIRWRVNGGTWSSWFALPSGSAWYLCAMLTPLSAASARQVWKVDSSAFTYSVPSGSAGWDDTAGGGGTPVGRADETDTAYALTAKQIRAAGLAAEADTAYSRAAVQIAATGRANEADTALALSAVLIRATGRANETDTAMALGRAVGIGRADESDAAFALVAVQKTAVGRADETDAAYALAPRQIGTTGRADEVDSALALGQPLGVGRADEADTAFALAPKQLRAPGVAIETDAAIALGRAVGITRANEADSAFALSLVVKHTVGRADESDSAFVRAAVQIAPVGRASETDYALTLTSGQSETVGLAIEADTAFARTALQLRVVGRSEEADTALALGAVQKRTTGLAPEADTALALASVSLRLVGAANENDSAFALAALQIGVAGAASESDTALALFPADYEIPPVPAERRVAVPAEKRSITVATEHRSSSVLAESRTITVPMAVRVAA